jgi:hypothetical protein
MEPYSKNLKSRLQRQGNAITIRKKRERVRRWKIRLRASYKRCKKLIFTKMRRRRIRSSNRL